MSSGPGRATAQGRSGDRAASTHDQSQALRRAIRARLDDPDPAVRETAGRRLRQLLEATPRAMPDAERALGPFSTRRPR
ncbi:hypothetical protein [uncultured Pseudokineococcus sp.]|uniref:hypothetical protein n=1 Tax=uncultured Pseudokineococcus sp. TaxID=1642928 RepID=UPI0026051AFD|nr:hypothetical protein [uncultured Pseudokineococcus sp.]